MQEYSIYRDNARDEGEKMKVKYKNLRTRKYTRLAEIRFDIEFLENLIADHGKDSAAKNYTKKCESDLILAREMHEVFKIINNL